MTPGIRQGESPPFYKLGEYVFQDLCRDILDQESDIATCAIYGERGEGQRGIDLLAHRKNNDGIEVGQCKCSKDFAPKGIRDASDEFFKHWDHWSQENVKRFILFVASDLSKIQRQDEILKQKKRFSIYDIKYEAWDAAQLRNKLRGRRDIVSTYCKPAKYWVKVICGEVLTSSPIATNENKVSVVVDTALISQNQQLVKFISDDTEQKLEQMRAKWQEGQKHTAINWIKELKDNQTTWTTLPSEVKAKVLLFEANLEIYETDKLDLVKKLSCEARDLAPSLDQTRLLALIAYREGKTEIALRLLTGKSDINSLNLRAAILLELGRIEDSRAILTFEDNRTDNEESQPKR